MSTEQWRRIPSAPSYEASDLGRVRSLKRGTPRILATRSKTGGYLRVSLEEPKARTVNVHILVAEAFYGPRPKGMVVRHLDGNPENNALGNLLYGTQSENEIDKVRHGTHNMARKTHCKRGHEFTPENTIVGERNGRPTRKCRACRAHWHASMTRSMPLEWPAAAKAIATILARVTDEELPADQSALMELWLDELFRREREAERAA